MQSSATAVQAFGTQQQDQQDKINFSLLRQYYQKQFIDYFSNIQGDKSLYIDPSFLKVLSFILGYTQLDGGQIKIKQKIILNEKKAIQPLNQTVIFVVRPQIDVVSKIIFQKDNWKSYLDKDVYILFVPRRTIECDELLNQNNLFNEEKVGQINMDLIPLEDDLLSLEQPFNFMHHMLQDDDTYKVYVQYSIHRLESVYGKILYKFGLGKISNQLIQRIEQNTLNIDQSSSNSTFQNQEPEIDALIMFDRDVDIISPFCYSQNYEGLIDEYFGIKTCSISVENKILHPDEKVREELKVKENESQTLDLTNEVTIFADIRNKHFNCAGPHLIKQLAEIQAMISDKNQKTIQELDIFIKKLKNMNLVKAKEIANKHINIAYHINKSQKNIDFIQIYGLEGKCILDDSKDVATILEGKILKNCSKMKILRTMCLYSSTKGGLQKEEFDQLRRAFIMVYGYQEIVTLMNLQDAGLFKTKDKKADWNWAKIKESYNLVNPDINFLEPSDISYILNGCAPLSVRTIELLIKNEGISNPAMKNLLKLIGLTDDKLRIPQNEFRFFNPEAPISGTNFSRSFKKRKILVYFLGGITFGEIAAIRFLQRLNPKYKFIIATTCIINGESALKEMQGPGTEAEDQGLLVGDILKSK